MSTSFQPGDYNEVCEECGGWDLRLTGEVWDDEANAWSVKVTCRTCGSDWLDFIDE